MGSTAQQQDATVRALYEAVSDDRGWPDALAGLCRAFDSPRVAILRTTPNLDGVFEMRALNHDPEAQQLYRDYYWALDPTLEASRSARLGEWFDCEHVLDPATTPSPEYVDFGIRHGIRHVAGAMVHGDAVSSTYLSLQRPADQGRFDDRCVAAFVQLGPHIGRAAALSADLRQAQLSNGISLAALDALPWPVYAVTAKAKLLLANRSGDTQLQLATPFGVHAGALYSSAADVNAKLKDVLAAAALRQGSAATVSHRHQRWWLRAVPVAAYSGVVLLYLTRAGGSKPKPRLLQQLLELSPAEAEVACLLAHGHSVKAIAQARGVSVWTVRYQLRAIMHKAGVRRQIDLAQVLMTLPTIDAAG